MVGLKFDDSQIAAKFAAGASFSNNTVGDGEFVER